MALSWVASFAAISRLDHAPPALDVRVVGGVVGLYASYYLSISAGASIVLACTLLFGLASLAARWRQRNTLPGSSAGCGP